MPRDSSGTYTKPPDTTAVTGTPISSVAYNTLANDQANALTDSLSRSGKGGMTAALNMGAQLVTNIATGISASDAVRLDQMTAAIQASSDYGGTSTGGGDVYAISMTPAITAYVTGRIYWFTAGATNINTAPTLTVNSRGQKQMFLIGTPGSGLQPGDIVVGNLYGVIDQGSHFQIINPIERIGTAGTRNVGTTASSVVEVVDGSGNLNAALNVANRQLTNLTSTGVPRVLWASIAFTGTTGASLGAAGGASVARNGVGLYTVSFPALAGAYEALAMMDVPVTANGNNINVVSGSRTTTSVQFSARSGNSSVDPFDPDRVTVTIHPIG